MTRSCLSLCIFGIFFYGCGEFGSTSPPLNNKANSSANQHISLQIINYDKDGKENAQIYTQQQKVEENAEIKKIEEERKNLQRLLEQIRLEKERLEQERLEQERLEQERLGKERLEQERLEQERLRKERLRKERLRKERLRKERLRKERLRKERLEKEKLRQEHNGEEKEDIPEFGIFAN